MLTFFHQSTELQESYTCFAVIPCVYLSALTWDSEMKKIQIHFLLSYTFES